MGTVSPRREGAQEPEPLSSRRRELGRASWLDPEPRRAIQPQVQVVYDGVLEPGL